MSVATGLWLLVMALVARFPRWGGGVVCLGAVPLLGLLPLPDAVNLARAYPGAWLLLLLAIEQDGLNSRWVRRSLLQGLVALMTVLLLRHWEALLGGSLASWLAKPLVWLCAAGLILVGWQLCRLLHGGRESLAYPLWVGSLALAIPAIATPLS